MYDRAEKGCCCISRGLEMNEDWRDWVESIVLIVLILLVVLTLMRGSGRWGGLF